MFRRVNLNNFDKLRERFEGPFEIVNVQPNKLAYEIKMCFGKETQVKRAHYDQLRPFYEAPQYLSKYIEPIKME